MLDADRPIVTSEQDRLGRTVFAKYLARCILDHQNSDSFVIGLQGGWGVGKTSIINLMLEELRFASSNMFDDEKPVIVNFSSWDYADKNRLISCFLRHLSFELSEAPYFEKTDRMMFLLETYLSFFIDQPVPDFVLPKHSWLDRIFKRKLLNKEKLGQSSGYDLIKLKAELDQLFCQQKHKLIIIIDNISCLEGSQIKQVFQIVKSIADYKNTIYLLSFDKMQMLPKLDHLLEERGADFLDKIIQLSFSVPPISLYDLEKILLSRLKILIEKHVSPESWDSHYWADLYYSALKNMFRHVRDVSRYLNMVRFNYEYVKDVVNPMDFFAITALEVFLPDVYDGIRDNKDLFTDLMDHVYELNEIKIEEDKARCDEILQRSEKLSHEQLLPLLLRLFPRLRCLYKRDSISYHSEELARQNKRICDPDVFDLYFGLSIPSGMVSAAEMKAILAMVSDEEGFALALLRLNKDNKIIPFLDSLDSYWVENISLSSIKNMVAALMDSADFFPEGEESVVDFTTLMRIHRIFQQLLARILTNEERYEIYRYAIEKAVNSLYSIVHELRVLSEERIGITIEQLANLKQMAVDKIVFWAEGGRLIEHPKLLAILYAWDDWGEPNACKQYVANVTQEDKGLLAFLEAALKKPIDQAESKWEKTPEWYDALKNIEHFIPVALLEPHAKRLFEDLEFEKLREREQLAILIFLDLIHSQTVKIIPKTS